MGQTLAEAGKPNLSKNVPGAHANVKAAASGDPWYQVVSGSFFSDRMYKAGERVQYAGEPPANLKPLVSAPVKQKRKKASEDDVI